MGTNSKTQKGLSKEMRALHRHQRQTFQPWYEETSTNSARRNWTKRIILLQACNKKIGQRVFQKAFVQFLYPIITKRRDATHVASLHSYSYNWNYSAFASSAAGASVAGASTAGAAAALFLERRVRVAFLAVLAMFSL